MGRRGIQPEQDDRWVFNRLADAYRSRPGYPTALLERLGTLSGPTGARVADLGAGTGHLAIPLAEAGYRVAAVEPARAMRESLESGARARGISNSIVPVAAVAEATGLPGGVFALVVIADALHWIDPDAAGREVARLLAPGGVAAVVCAQPAATSFMTGLTALLEAANPKVRRRAASRTSRQLLAMGAPGEAVTEERFDQAVVLDGASLEAILRSLSYVGPALGPEALGDVIERAHELAMRCGGAVWARELRLSWARCRADARGGPGVRVSPMCAKG